MPRELPAPRAAERREVALRSGLCAGCRHLRILRSKTSAFLRCGLSDHDPRFPRYPLLPVLACPGFAPAGPPEEGSAAAGLSETGQEP